MKRKTLVVLVALALCATAACKKSNTAKRDAKIKENALRVVVQEDDVSEARRLIKSGVDVNARNDKGETALIWTARNISAIEDYKGVAELLVNAGADVNIEDNNGNTALMIAEGYGVADVIAFLEAAGAK